MTSDYKRGHPWCEVSINVQKFTGTYEHCEYGFQDGSVLCNSSFMFTIF